VRGGNDGRCFTKEEGADEGSTANKSEEGGPEQ